MVSFKSVVSILFLFLYVNSLNARVVTVFKARSINPSLPTHVLVIGDADKVDDLFLRTAQTKLLKYHDLYPNHQKIIFLAKGEGNQQSRFKNRLKDFGHTVIFENNRKQKSKHLYKHLKNIRNILTIDFVTHSSVEVGIGLDKGRAIMTYDNKHLYKLKSNFGTNGYIVLHGCNTGFKSAPNMSQRLGIPVFGSLTSTDFQVLHEDGNWYFNNDGQYPVGKWANQNKKSFSEIKSCKREGGCVRMKPVNHPYRGMWGSYKVGLPFYRVFCGTSISMKKCQNATYLELLAWPSIKNKEVIYDKKSYISIALDYLCPRNATSTDYDICRSEVLRSEYDASQTSFPFIGPELTCFKENCHWGMKTTRRLGRKIPIFYQTKKSKRGQIINEFLNFLEIYR